MSGRRQFVYQPRTIEDVQQRQADTSSDSPGIIMDQFKNYQVRKGDNWVRILPATWEGARHWAFDTWVHYGVGPDKATVICNNRMNMGKCFGCELRMDADRAGDEEASKALRPRRRATCWMIDRKAEEEGPQLWAMPSTLDDDIQGVSIDKTDGQLYLVDDPNSGYDVTFDKTGERLLTRYNSANLAKRPSAVHPAFIDYVVDNPVPTCLIWRTYEEVKAMYEGGMGGDQAPAHLVEPPRNFGRNPAPQAMPARGGPGGAPIPPRYPPTGPAPQAGPALPARRPFGQPPVAPPAYAGPVDNYQGEEYAVDPNYPPPEQGGYYPNGNGVEQGQWDTTGQGYNDAPPWEEPPAQQYQPPQQYAPPVQQYSPPAGPAPRTGPTMPQRRPMPPAQPPAQYAPPQQYQQPAQPPQQQYAQPPAPPAPQWPGRTAAAPPAPPGRGGTSPSETAAQLRQQFGRR